MSKEDAEKRSKKLREFLTQWNYDYFIENKATISESARDQMKRELQDLEEAYPEFITPDSPTQRIGAPLDGRLNKVRHKTKKQSLEDVFGLGEIEEWQKRVQRILPREQFEYVTELKIDGLNITLWYEQGLLVKALTRGDGSFGEDVTHSIRTIEEIPLRLPEPENAEISGEVYLRKSVFEQLKEKENFANTRNVAAGSIRQLDPEIAASRKLSAFFYTLKNEEQLNQDDVLKTLKAWHLPTEPHWKKHADLAGVESFIQHWTPRREGLDYGIDGIVIKINDRAQQERLGSTARTPRFAAAYKFPATQSTTIVEDIVCQVGRTGAITPVAKLRPTLLDGSTISRATLHNEEEMIRKDVRIGDTVIIQKAGDVIPEVVEVVTSLRAGKEKVFSFPRKCPVCETLLSKPEGEVIARCPNVHCPGKRRESLYHFVGKKGFDIEALGEKIVDQLIDRSLISSPADIFKLTFEEIYSLDLFEQKRTENLLRSIDHARLVPFSKFLFALGIRHIGEKTAKDIAAELQRKIHFHQDVLSKQQDQGSLFFLDQHKGTFEYTTPKEFLETLHHDSVLKEDLATVEGIGPKAIESLSEWLAEKTHRQLLLKLSEHDVKIVKEVSSTEFDSAISGKTFVITGTFEHFSREELKSRILRKGGKVSDSVSSKTYALLCGESPGSKLKKAQELGVEVWDEKIISAKFS